MTLVLQNELKRVGCEPGKVDGKWGRKGSTALAKFNVYAKLKLSTDAPTMDALEAVKGAKERVCPLICGPQFNKTGDQCVKKSCRAGQKLSKRGQCIKYGAPRRRPVVRAAGLRCQRLPDAPADRGGARPKVSRLRRPCGLTGGRG